MNQNPESMYFLRWPGRIQKKAEKAMIAHGCTIIGDEWSDMPKGTRQEYVGGCDVGVVDVRSYHDIIFPDGFIVHCSMTSGLSGRFIDSLYL
jgi:hypothetical protein